MTSSLADWKKPSQCGKPWGWAEEVSGRRERERQEVGSSFKPTKAVKKADSIAAVFQPGDPRKGRSLGSGFFVPTQHL